MSTITNEMVAQAKAGNSQAAAAIVTDMAKTIDRWATALCGKHHHDDAVAEGMAALWEAVLTFDPDRGVVFYTHARRMVRLAIQNFVGSNNDGPSVHERTARRYYALMAEAGDDVTKAAAMADDPERNFSSTTFMAAHRALEMTDRLDRYTVDEDGGTTSTALDEASMTAVDTVDVEETALNRVVVDALLGECNEREVLILSMTYGIGGHTEMKDQDIADALGISRPRVVTIRKAAQERLAAENTELAGVI